MPRKTIAEMPFKDVYAALISKAERKGRTKDEVYEVTSWLTGYSISQIEEAMGSEISYASFFSACPSYHPRSELIKGKICGVRVEEIEDPFMKKVRQLDKLIDELAKGKTMEKIKR